ncbi:MAG: ABC transporter ATP-binding protein [Planctomycetota bacterium]
MAAITFEHVGKTYLLAHQRRFLAREVIQALLARPARVERLSALTDVSFRIERGESLGVVGTNGAGKSTLLSLIAGTSRPTSGRVEVNGRIGPLLELGAGFHMDLTGAENVYLNAALLGLSRQEVDARFDAIVEFSGLRDFIDAPIKTYSTGMAARLGFSVIAHIEPDILLIDELLSVGDKAFQSKCKETMESFLARGVTVVLVSHDLAAITSLCKWGLWLEKGRVRAFGPAAEVVPAYARSFPEYHGRTAD